MQKLLTPEQRDWLYNELERLIKYCIEDEEKFIALSEAQEILNQCTEKTNKNSDVILQEFIQSLDDKIERFYTPGTYNTVMGGILIGLQEARHLLDEIMNDTVNDE